MCISLLPESEPLDALGFAPTAQMKNDSKEEQRENEKQKE